MANRNIFATSILIFLAFANTSVADGLPLAESFESGDAVPDGWRKGASIPGVQYIYDKETASDGERSLSLQKSANRYFPIAQWTRELDHDGSAITFEMSANVKAAKATKAIVEVQFYDGSSQMIGKEWLAYIGQKQAGDRPASHTWKEYSGEAAVPAGTKRLVLALQIYGPGKVWFDELKVNQAGAKNDATKKTASSAAKSREKAASVPAVKVQSLQVGSGGWTRFVVIPPSGSTSKSPPKPASGYEVLFVLPGGNGSIDFQPFVQSVSETALDGRYLVIELLAPPQVVWPTAGSRSRFATTEAAIEGILEKLSEKVAINRSRVFALAWSSSGPAVYSSLLKESSPLSGAFIAMSVFKPNHYPSLGNASGKRIYLLHSPEDTTCPYPMAQRAEKALKAAGANVQLTDYVGGHGWHGDVMTNIRTGMDWLSNE